MEQGDYLFFKLNSVLETKENIVNKYSLQTGHINK